MPELLTIDDLKENMDFSELAQIAGIGSHNAPEGRSLDEVKIETAIKYASDMAKGYLQRRYPIISEIDASQTPDFLKGLLSDIVRHRLRARTSNRNTVSDEVETRKKDAIAWLRDVSSGKANLDLSDIEGGDIAQDQAAVNHSGKVHTSNEPLRAGTILAGYRDV